jgi:hypothetical protein
MATPNSARRIRKTVRFGEKAASAPRIEYPASAPASVPREVAEPAENERADEPHRQSQEQGVGHRRHFDPERLGAAPLVFGKLIESGARASIFGGYVFAAILMFAAAIVAALYAVNAERKPLEEVATPLSAVG